MPSERNGSATIEAMFCRGSSDEYGSWNTVCTDARNRRIADAVTGSPSNSTDPADGFASASISRTIVDLPLPDSPTRPTLWPSPTAIDTSSSARAPLP
jgi:hypothetical protein